MSMGSSFNWFPIACKFWLTTLHSKWKDSCTKCHISWFIPKSVNITSFPSEPRVIYLVQWEEAKLWPQMIKIINDQLIRKSWSVCFFSKSHFLQSATFNMVQKNTPLITDWKKISWSQKLECSYAHMSILACYKSHFTLNPFYFFLLLDRSKRDKKALKIQGVMESREVTE